MYLHFNEIVELTQATIYKNAATNEHALQHIINDSRRISFPENSLFIAFVSAHNDGHLYIQQAYDAGVRNFLLSQLPTNDFPLDVNIACVKDTLQALQTIAKHIRIQLSSPLIGITGSNGKTIVKEWLHQLLHEQLILSRSPKSYNSQLGVPLSLCQFTMNSDLYISEAGISKRGEMLKLEEMLQPEWGIFNYLGTAHDEGFETLEEKLHEKFKLFKHSRFLVLSADQSSVLEAARRLKNIQLFTWTKSNNEADISFQINKKDKYSECEAQVMGKTHTFQIPFTDEASIWNACSCASFIFCYFSDEKIINESLKNFAHLSAVEMRLQVKSGINNNLLINDSYSNDILSLQIALESMQQYGHSRQSTLILSDLPIVEEKEAEVYKRIADMLTQQKIMQLIGVGNGLKKYAHYFSGQSYFYENTDQLVNHIHSLHLVNRLILIKGARKFEFERIDRLLEKKHHETVFEINLSALQNNVKTIRNALPQNTKIMAMVKAFGYGSGGHEIALALENARTDYLAVAYSDEGVELREAGVQIPIMVMNTEYSAIDAMLMYNLEPEIYNFSSLQHVIEKSNGADIGIHLEFDTGMKRLGFEYTDLEHLLLLLNKNQNIYVKSVFTHLAASEDSQHDAFTFSQLQNFENICSTIENSLTYPFIKHCLNTGGISRFSSYAMNMVRAGIGLYGIDPANQLALQRIGTLKTVISQIRELNETDSIGYGRIGKGAQKIAVTAIGYADGLNRLLSNGKGWMMVNGKRANIIGNICMDMTMIDVSGIDCKEGDEVIVMGESPTLFDIAAMTNSIPYEVLTSISQRVKRVYYNE